MERPPHWRFTRGSSTKVMWKGSHPLTSHFYELRWRVPIGYTTNDMSAELLLSQSLQSFCLIETTEVQPAGEKTRPLTHRRPLRRRRSLSATSGRRPEEPARGEPPGSDGTNRRAACPGYLPGQARAGQVMSSYSSPPPLSIHLLYCAPLLCSKFPIFDARDFFIL